MYDTTYSYKVIFIHIYEEYIRLQMLEELRGWSMAHGCRKWHEKEAPVAGAGAAAASAAAGLC